MPQCSFVNKGFVIDPDDFEIYHNYNCVKPEGHSGKHSFYKNPSKFFRHWRTAEAERQKILQRLVIIVQESRKNVESKRDNKIQETIVNV